MDVYATNTSVTEHVVMKDGDDIPLEHVRLDINSPEVAQLRFQNYFRHTAFLYGAPFEASTTYRARISDCYVGGSFTKERTFTTGTRRPWSW